MGRSGLGKVYHDGEVIIREGEVGHEMYVIQDGEVDILVEHEGEQRFLRKGRVGEFFGEMAIFDRAVRSATVRASGDVRVLTVDESTLLRRINEDPSLAFEMIKNLSNRIRELSSEIARLKAES